MQVGLILAAGSGSRMGGPKAALVVNGARLIDRAVSLFTEAGISELFVVLGAWHGEVPSAKIINNRNWESGMGTSLKLGLEELNKNANYSSVVISLVDLPGMTVRAINKVADCDCEIAVGTYNGVQGHPVKIARKYWPEVIELVHGEKGAKQFLSGRNDICLIPLEDLANCEDIDSPEDLARFLEG